MLQESDMTGPHQTCWLSSSTLVILRNSLEEDAEWLFGSENKGSQWVTPEEGVAGTSQSSTPLTDRMMDFSGYKLAGTGGKAQFLRF